MVLSEGVIVGAVSNTSFLSKAVYFAGLRMFVTDGNTYIHSDTFSFFSKRKLLMMFESCPYSLHVTYLTDFHQISTDTTPPEAITTFSVFIYKYTEILNNF